MHTTPTQYRVRFSKLACKSLVQTVTRGMRKWFHDDPSKLKHKLLLLRTLESDDEKDEDMLDKIRVFLASALVDYAIGKPTIKAVKPYGLPASRCVSS